MGCAEAFATGGSFPEVANTSQNPASKRDPRLPDWKAHFGITESPPSGLPTKIQLLLNPQADGTACRSRIYLLLRARSDLKCRKVRLRS
jgi:hypothetical protein